MNGIKACYETSNGNWEPIYIESDPARIALAETAEKIEETVYSSAELCNFYETHIHKGWTFIKNSVNRYGEKAELWLSRKGGKLIELSSNY